MLTITRTFKFEAAHKLDFRPQTIDILNYKGECNKLHGHSYHGEIEINNGLNSLKNAVDSNGMIIDFSVLKTIIINSIEVPLDHSYLNDIIENPTVENLVWWIKERMEEALEEKSSIQLERVRLWETSKCYAEWKRDR